MNRLIYWLGSLITVFGIVFCIGIAIFIFPLVKIDPYPLPIVFVIFISSASLFFAWFFYFIFCRIRFYGTANYLNISRENKKKLKGVFENYWKQKNNKDFSSELKTTVHHLLNLDSQVIFEEIGLVPLRGEYGSIVGWEFQGMANDHNKNENTFYFMNMGITGSSFHKFQLNQISIEDKSKAFLGKPAVVLEYKPKKFFKIQSEKLFAETLRSRYGIQIK